MDVPTVVLLVFAPIFLIFAFLTVRSMGTTRRLLATAQRVQGQIVEHRRKRNRDNRTHTYAPVFTFTGGDGREHRVESTTFTNKARELGPVTVLVPADQPEKAKIDTAFGRWGTTIILGLLTAAFLVASVVLLVVVVS